MPKIEVLTPFRFAVDGVRIIEIAPGVQDVADDVAQVAIAAGWATDASAPSAKVSNKARTKVPEVG